MLPNLRYEARNCRSRGAITAVVAFPKVPAGMAVAVFLNWEPGDANQRQLIDGEPARWLPPNAVRAYLQGKLGRPIGDHRRVSGLPCDVFTNPGVVPATTAAHDMRVPDLAVSCSPFDLTKAAPAYPVLIVEIISPGNRADA